MSGIENNPCIDTTTFDDVVFYLLEHYERNVIADLQEDEMEILTNVSDKIETMYNSFEIDFDKEAFMMLIKRLYPNSIMLGGNGELVDYTNTPSGKMVFNILDFAAIIAFIVSIYLIYLSFIQFNQLSCNITGNNVVELSSEIKEQLSQTIQSLSGQEFAFTNYIYNIFTTFTSNVVSTQQQRISTIIQTLLKTSIPDFTQQVTSQCITSETGWTGFFETTAKTFVSPEATSNCVMSMSQTLIAGFLQQQQQQINILLTGLQTNSLQIQNLVVYGVRLGYASTGYLAYRIMQIRRGIANVNQMEEIQEGGKKRRKRKTVKKTKKSKKSKRNNKKNKSKRK
jgi:hypothetical protein